MRTTVFSKYEVRKLGIKMSDGTAYKNADCMGSMEEELDVIVLTKKCRGIVETTRPRGAGTGTLTWSLHMPYDMYCDLFDMVRDDLVKGVQGYGRNNFHKEFAVTMDVYNEDNEQLLLAYPRCIMAVGPNTTIENGAEEVAEIEVEVSVMPDENGYCRYECMPEDLETGDTAIATTWMTAFTPELVEKTPSA